MRRAKTTTYGQRGGDGPNTGRSRVTYEATAPDGTVLTKRFYKDPPVGQFAKAALIAPYGGYGWTFWTAVDLHEELPDYVQREMHKPGLHVVSCFRKGG